MKIIISAHKPFTSPAAVLGSTFNLSTRKAKGLAKDGGELELDLPESDLLNLAAAAEAGGVKLDICCA